MTIQENDTQAKVVRQEPWFFGKNLADIRNFDEAIEASGLTWEAVTAPVKYDWNGETFEMPKTNVVIRNDNGYALGTGSLKYYPYQNASMWEFIRRVYGQMDKRQARIETAGSLDGGSRVWVLVRNGFYEPVKNDRINKYFLFVNAFDGSMAIKTLFTDIRVVCRNTLARAIAMAEKMAEKGLQTMYSVKHTRNADLYLEEAAEMLGLRAAYDENAAELMTNMAQRAMTEKQMRSFLDELYPIRTVEVEDAEERISISSILKDKKVNRIMELVEVGAGADIPGVRGTEYGLYNAITEYADHEKLSIRAKGANEEETRFKSVFWGSAQQMKQDALDAFMRRAQAN